METQPQSVPAENQAPVAPPANTPAPESTVNWEAKYNELQSQFTENQRIIANAEAFISQDPEVKDRLNLWKQSFDGPKPYSDLIAERGRSTAKPSKEETSQVNLQQEIDRLVSERLNSAISPMSQELAAINAERDAQTILKANPWATEKDLETFQTELMKMVQTRAQAELKANWPRMTPQQAEDRAWAAYSNTDINLLFNGVMREQRDAAILSNRRPAPKLPSGMTDNVTTGKDPALMEKVQKALKANEGTDQVASIIKEYAPQFGVDPDDKNGVIELYKTLTSK